VLYFIKYSVCLFFQLSTVFFLEMVQTTPCPSCLPEVPGMRWKEVFLAYFPSLFALTFGKVLITNELLMTGM
jgi:hypothetical protein